MQLSPSVEVRVRVSSSVRFLQIRYFVIKNFHEKLILQFAAKVIVSNVTFLEGRKNKDDEDFPV